MASGKFPLPWINHTKTQLKFILSLGIQVCNVLLCWTYCSNFIWKKDIVPKKASIKIRITRGLKKFRKFIKNVRKGKKNFYFRWENLKKGKKPPRINCLSNKNIWIKFFFYIVIWYIKWRTLPMPVCSGLYGPRRGRTHPKPKTGYPGRAAEVEHLSRRKNQNCSEL